MCRPEQLLVCLALALGACPAESTTRSPDAVFDAETDDGTDARGDGSWHAVHAGLDEAVLSIWGRAPDDIWLVGADEGAGPLVLEGGPDGWVRRETGTAGGLWWVTSPCPQTLFMVGEAGTVLSYDTATEAFTPLDAGTAGTFFGAWGASCDRVWAVGGHVYPASGPPLLLRIEGGQAELQPLPAGVDPDVTLFKVWGTPDGQAWAIGERGTMLHFDGQAWAAETPLDGKPRLVTLSGQGDDRVIVGGAQQALILEHDARDGGWADASPGPYAALNGVFVSPGGDALAAGFLGSVFLRQGGVWQEHEMPPGSHDWHAAWIDARGDRWVVGGNLLSAGSLDGGAVYRFGPPRHDVPSTVGEPIPVVPAPEPADVGPEPAPDQAEVVAEAEPDATEAMPDAAEAEPDVVESETDAADAGPDAVDADPDVAEPAPDAGDAEITPASAVTLGAVADGLVFTPWQPGQEIEIVQGPQGGVHVEAAFAIDLGPGPAELPVTVVATTTIEGAVVGSGGATNYPINDAGGGVYLSWIIPVVFDQDVATPYVGKQATVELTVTPPSGQPMTGTADISLVDWF